MPKNLVLSNDEAFGEFSPVDVVTGETLEDTVIKYRYMGKAEMALMYRQYATVGARQRLEVDWPRFYEAIAVAAIIGFSGILTKDGKDVPCTTETKQSLPDWVLDQVVDKCKGIENCLGPVAVGNAKEESSGGQEASPEGPTQASPPSSEAT